MVVLITGASSGIGEALAYEFGSRGYSIALVARRTDKLQKIEGELKRRGVPVLFEVADVVKAEELKRAVDRVRQVFGRIDIVFANAGFGVAGNAHTISIADYERQFETNFFGVLRTFYATIDDLRKTKGSFCITGSVNGFVALPGNSAYVASKFAVRGLAYSLYHELRPFGVAVTHIAPGFVDSDIRRTDNHGLVHEGHRDPIPAWIRVPADKAAKSIAKAVLRRQREVVITGHGKFITRFYQYFPGLFHKLVQLFRLSSRSEP